MATSGTTLVERVSLRVRDPSNTATGRSQVLLLLSEAQRLVNGIAEEVVATATLTVPPYRTILPIEENVPTALRVTGVRDENGRSMSPVPWGALAHANRRWWRATATRSRVWSTIGRDMLVVSPAAPDTQLLTVVFVKKTDVLATEAAVTEVTNATDDTVGDLVEALLLLKTRRLDAVAGPLKRLAEFAGGKVLPPEQRPA